jgi:hypothetical protein
MASPQFRRAAAREPLNQGQAAKRKTRNHQKPIQRRHGTAFRPLNGEAVSFPAGRELNTKVQGEVPWSRMTGQKMALATSFGPAVLGIMWTRLALLSPSLVSWVCGDTISGIPGGRGERGSHRHEPNELVR